VSVDDFLAGFFGPGNDVLPDRDFSGATGQRLVRWLEPLRSGRRVPVVLPRRVHGAHHAYVLCWDRAQATAVRATLEAFVAHSYAPFDGRTARLDPSDPVHRAVLTLVGPGLTYILKAPDEARTKGLWNALDRMRALHAARPARVAQVPRPVGRILAEFHAALAAGNAAGSGDLLDELGVSGLSAVNVAYLGVHRLSRLGRDVEVLQSTQLADIVASGPPPVVRDALLAAWYRVRLRDVAPESSGFRDSAVLALDRDGDLVLALARGPAGQLSDDALGALAALAVVEADSVLAQRIALEAPDPVLAALRPLLPSADEPPAEEGSPPGATPKGRPTSWTEWVSRLDALRGVDIDPSDWSTPVDEDAPLAAAIERVNDLAVDDAWAIAGPFLEADDFGRPAVRSARALLVLAVAYDRWGPADLATMQALLEVFLRGAPPAKEYAEVLDMLTDHAPRWAVTGNALPVLDMLDDLARMPVADEAPRLRFALAALGPLSRQRRRLQQDQLWLAKQLDGELGVDLEWHLPDPDAGDSSRPTLPTTAARVLIYSLDEGVLQRTAGHLAELYPDAKVYTSAERVGTTRLREHARNADVVALATRCAKHAATGFIRSHAVGATVVEADGAGSASLTRAVALALGGA
jgi:hypothetical protein